MTDIDDRLARARAEGYSWDEISGFLGDKRQEALKEGYTNDEIDQFLGFSGDKGMSRRLRGQAEANMSALEQTTTPLSTKTVPEVSSYMDAFVHGLESSSGGLLARGAEPEKEMPTDPGRMMRLANLTGTLIGDIPAMVTGFSIGGAAGTAVAPGVGTVLGSGAGAFALPELIKREYIQALHAGEVKDSWDFADKQAAIWWDVAKQAVIGATTGGAGKVVGAGLKVAGFGAVSRTAGTAGAELATMTTVAAALEGHLPTREEFIDGAVLIAGFHVAAGGAHIAERGLGVINENLQRHWAATGERPMEALQKAQEDPAFRLSLVSPQPPDAPPGSSRTDAGIYGDFVVARDPDPAGNTGRELPPGVKFEANAPRDDANDSPIEHTARLTGPDGEVLHSADVTQIDEKLWDVDNLNAPGAQGMLAPSEKRGPGYRHQWTDEQDDTIRGLAAQGLGGESIGKQMGIAPDIVRRRMKALEIERDDSKDTIGTKPGTKAYEMLRMMNEGRSDRYIADKLKHPFNAVTAFRSKVGNAGLLNFNKKTFGEDVQSTGWYVDEHGNMARQTGSFEAPVVPGIERSNLADPNEFLPEEGRTGSIPGTWGYKVLKLLKKGMSDPEIADELGLTLNHVNSLRSKMGVARAKEAPGRSKWQPQGIMENRPGAVDTETAFFANLAKYASDRGGRLMTGIKGDGLPVETLDRLDEAGLLEEVKTGKSTVYQIHSDRMPEDQGVRSVSGNSPSLGLAHSVAAKTGDANVDAVINRPKVKEAIDNPKIDRTKDVPDWAGASGPADDLRTHVDRHLPRQIMLNGVTFDPAVPLNIHEQVERSKMEELIPEFMKPGKDGTPGMTKEQAEKQAYEVAHREYATLAEHSWLRSHNIPVDEYEAMIEEWSKSIDSYDPENLPPDLYMLNKHGPAPLGPQGIVAQGQPTGAAGPTGLPATSSVKPRLPSSMNAIALGIPWTGTREQAMDALLSKMAEPPKVGMWQKVRDNWFQFYREMFRKDHAIWQASEAMRGAGTLTEFNDPKHAFRAVELASNTARYAIERGMFKLESMGSGDIPEITGPGLNDILEPMQANKAMWKRFTSYAIGRRAIDLAQRNLTTGMDLTAAHEVVDAENAGGVTMRPHDPRDVARTLGVPINDIGPGRPAHPIHSIGPHYMPGPRPEVNMLPPGDPFYTTLMGPYMTYDVVLAHEVGHAVADRLGFISGARGISPADAEALRQELTMHSRRYKPDFWANKTNLAKMQQLHIRKEGELMADAFATWMTEPGARARMPVFQRIVGLDNLERTVGAVPEQLGTPVSRAFEDLVDYQNGTLEWLRDAGIMDTERLIKLKAENSAYLPFIRADQAQARAEQVKGAGAGSNVFDPVKSFVGSENSIQDMMKSLLQNTFLRFELARRNMAVQSLADELQPLNLAGKKTPRAMKLALTKDELNKIIDLASAPIGPATRSLMDTPDNFEIWRALGIKADPGDVPIFRNGKLEKWGFEDPDLTRFLRGLDNQSRAVLTKFAAAVIKPMRAGIVLQPLFPIRLATYDVPWQFVTKPGFENTLKTMFVGMRHVFGNTALYDQWMRSQGAERIFDGATKTEFIQDMLRGRPVDLNMADSVMNNLATPYHMLRGWAQRWSQVQRVGRYVRGIQEFGETPRTAAMASTESAFHRAGFGGDVSATINSTMPFFRAYLNSLEQFTRGQFGIGRTFMGQKYDPVGFTAKAAMVITAPMLLNWWTSRDSDWYKAVPDWQKDNGLLFHIGPDDGTGHTMFFKLPPLISFMYGGLPRRLAAAFVADNPGLELDKAWKGILPSFLPSGILASGAYTVLTPIVEKFANYSFFRDQPLVPDDVKRNFSPDNQFNHYSSATAKALSRGLTDVPILRDMHLNPVEIDNFITGWTGTIGEGMVRMAEDLLQRSGVAPELSKAELKFPDEYPFFKSWFARYPSASAQPIRDFSDAMTHREQIHGDLVKAMTSGDLPHFNKILDENPTLGAFHSFKMRGSNAMQIANRPDRGEFLASLQAHASLGDQRVAQTVLEVDKALKNLRQRAIVEENTRLSSELSSTDKRQHLDQIYSMMQTYAQGALELMDKTGMRR